MPYDSFAMIMTAAMNARTDYYQDATPRHPALSLSALRDPNTSSSPPFRALDVQSPLQLFHTHTRYDALDS